MNTDNGIAKMLFYFGVAVMVIGALAAFVFGSSQAQGSYDGYTAFSWFTFLFWFIGGLLLGALFIGFGEAIRLLDNIDKNGKNQNDKK